MPGDMGETPMPPVPAGKRGTGVSPVGLSSNLKTEMRGAPLPVELMLALDRFRIYLLSGDYPCLAQLPQP